MPTLADVQAATPKCPNATADRAADRIRVDELCGQLLRYDAPLELWDCPRHGHVLSGPQAGAIYAAWRDDDTIDGVPVATA